MPSAFQNVSVRSENTSQISHEQEQEAVLKATAVQSPLPAGNVIDSSSSSLSSPRRGGRGVHGGVWQGRGGLVGGGGSGRGGGGRGHFIQAAIYCIITWCFAQKGLCTSAFNML